MSRLATGLLIVILAVLAPGEARALIVGGVGHEPIRDPGWPKGGAAPVNDPGRVAWWEGPPFGGGQWHAEFRGDAKALNVMLEKFAALDVKAKTLVVHDGAGRSFFADKAAPKPIPVDWVVVVWQADRWQHLHAMPADLNPTSADDTSPPAEVWAYAGGLNWSDVEVPDGIVVDDRRLVAHGYGPADGTVIEGKVREMATGKALAARVRLQRVEPRKGGGYLHPVVAEARSDAQGRWVLKHAPAGWVRVVVDADGFVPRVAGYATHDGPPRWASFDCELARAASVSGRVVDEGGKPLADAEVSLADVTPASGGRYESDVAYRSRTDASGRFRMNVVPVGAASVWVHKPGYHGPGRGQAIRTPGADVEVIMKRAGSLRVTVDFGELGRVGDDLVKLASEGGEVIGSYGGAGNVDSENRMTFAILPPGRYVLRGRPNPGSDGEEAGSLAVEIKAGETTEVTLKAR